MENRITTTMEQNEEGAEQSPSSDQASHRVHVTRNAHRKKGVSTPEDLPIMEVFQKIEDLSLNEDEQEMPETFQMTMENADDTNEPIDFHCEAVKKEDGSVQYECRFSQETSKQFPRVTGKFSLNVPYVALKSGKGLKSFLEYRPMNYSMKSDDFSICID